METTAATSQSTSSQTVSSTGSTGSISSDFDTFLQMLTAQIENQDPLNPIDSADFAVQLATFSGVEQQVRTNDLLEGLAQSLSLGGVAEIADWVGMEARADVPTSFTGNPIALYPDYPADADAAVLSVRDASGGEVQRIAVPLGAEVLIWDGTDNSGVPVADGTYSFTIEGFADGSLVGTNVPETWAQVTEARVEDGAAMAVFADGSKRLPDDVRGLRAADTIL